jgi:hypothetical protein
MNQNAIDLYGLLPAIYRVRDAESGYPLRGLMQVVAEQVEVVTQDISQLYDNWFIETCNDWVVPYLSDLIGYRRVAEAGLAAGVGDERERARNRYLVPRREVAKTIQFRRRKGALALLEELAWDVAGWPARAVEFAPLLVQSQAVNHVRLARGGTVDMRDMTSLELIYRQLLEPESRERLLPAEAVHERLISHGAFDPLSHNVDVRRIDSGQTTGRYNLPNVGLFVFRLKSYRIFRAPAVVQPRHPNWFTVSPLGNAAPLFIKSEREVSPTDIAQERNLPVPLRRRSLDSDLRNAAAVQNAKPSFFYGPEKTLAIWTTGWPDRKSDAVLVPPDKLIVADLSNWEAYLPPKDKVAVDPVLGRIVFAPRQIPPSGVDVAYHYGFSADLGGGPYERRVSQPSGARIIPVGKDENFNTIDAAKDEWLSSPETKNTVIEITDNRTYRESFSFELPEGHSLQLRAKNGCRPVVWLRESENWSNISGGPLSRFVLDGILIAGAPLNITGELDELTIRHSTLMPGVGLGHDCKPQRPNDPSLVLLKTSARVIIEHSIVGTVQVRQDEVRSDPVPIRIADSILDATSTDRDALGSDANLLAHAVLTLERSTVVGSIDVHAVQLAENSILLGHLRVGRRQLGCIRFCYVDPSHGDKCSRTPRRFHCQPDLALAKLEQRADWESLSPTAKAALKSFERARIRPAFHSLRFGLPTYCQLAHSCSPEIKRGADDQSEMGAFHDLYEPQRFANLDTRLHEYTPAGNDAGIIFAT